MGAGESPDLLQGRGMATSRERRARRRAGLEWWDSCVRLLVMPHGSVVAITTGDRLVPLTGGWLGVGVCLRGVYSVGKVDACNG